MPHSYGSNLPSHRADLAENSSYDSRVSGLQPLKIANRGLNLDFLKIEETEGEDDSDYEFDINTDSNDNKQQRFKRIYDAKYKIPPANKPS